MKLLFALFAIAFTIGMSLVGMIYGWGLTPENWGWITVSYMAVCIPSLIQALIE